MLLSKNQPVTFICAVGGKSGGHVIPCLSHITCKKNSNPSLKALFFHSNDDLTHSIVISSLKVDCPISLSVPPVPYGMWYMFPVWIVQIGYAFLKSFAVLLWYKPAEVMSSGGIEAIPVCLAARLLKIPIRLLELNATPGKAITFLSRFVDEIEICFEQTARYFPRNKTIITPYPLRFSATQLICSREQALRYYDLSAHKKTIVILGGSQGSKSLNKLALLSLTQLTQTYKNFQVIHQIGHDDFITYKTIYRTHTIEAIVIPFEQSVHYLYQIADIIIARAGAGTLFEIEAFKKHAIIIPLITSTTDHQYDNALAFHKKNPTKFTVFNQKDLENNSDLLTQKILELCSQPHSLADSTQPFSQV